MKTLLSMFALGMTFLRPALQTHASASVSTSSRTFHLQDNHVGESFFDGSFSWQTFDDPTGGRVNYVDMPTAQALNLSYGTSC